MTAGGGSKNFFVSCSGADRAWAEWIAWVLEEAGYTVVLQAWDFPPGSNFVLEMQQAAAQAERTIAVFSPDFLASRFTAPEWAAAFARDPTGALGLLLPVRVRECEPPPGGLLPQIVYIDLLGLEDKNAARDRLLAGVKRERAKPAGEVAFPGSAAPPGRREIPEEPRFPGVRPSWRDYEDLFELGKFRLAYIPLINDPASTGAGPRSRHSNESLWINGTISELPWTSIDIDLSKTRHHIPRIFQDTQIDFPFRDEASCRLARFDVDGHSGLRVTLQETSYGDYLRSGEHLDDPLHLDSRETFRSLLAMTVNAGGGIVNPEELTNICGTGIFIRTTDGRIIVSRHSVRSHVYPGRRTFSASGLMKWGAYPHPFTEVARKTFMETGHQVDYSKACLISLGADARKLYFQFGFYEEITASEIIERHRDMKKKGLLSDAPDDLIALPFAPVSIVNDIMEHCWEPSAEACILTLCAKQFGAYVVSQAIHRWENDWWKRAMRDEWDLRASRKADLPDMSVRYPQDRLEAASKDYVEAVLEFMQNDVREKNVVEVGSGTGRLTLPLVKKATQLTCVELCEKMIERNRQRLAANKSEKMPHYVHAFMQDYIGEHDVAVCSLVLVHNVEPLEYAKLVDRICECADTVFVFEDVAADRPTDMDTTKLRSGNDIIEEFGRRYFRLKKQRKHPLFDDQILFMKFCKSGAVDAR